MIGGALAVMVAIGTNGIPSGVVMLAVVLVANLLVTSFCAQESGARSERTHPS